MLTQTYVGHYFSTSKRYLISLYQDKYHHVMNIFEKKYNGEYVPKSIVLHDIEKMTKEEAVEKTFDELTKS